MKASELIKVLQEIIDKEGDHIVGGYNGVWADILDADDVFAMELYDKKKDPNASMCIGNDQVEEYGDTKIIVLWDNSPDSEYW